MKSFVAVLALVALAAADVSHIISPEATATALVQNSDVGPDSFQYQLETSNGIFSQASGALKNVGKDEAALAVSGSDSYTAPDGTVIRTDYTADENGYHPQGLHLPTPPPTQAIPEYIIRSIEFNKAHAPPADTEINNRRF